MPEESSAAIVAWPEGASVLKGRPKQTVSGRLLCAVTGTSLEREPLRRKVDKRDVIETKLKMGEQMTK